MKKLTIFISLFFAILISCNKDDDPISPIDQLPAATQTGAGTFGCLVNGEPFIDNSGSFNCFYQFVDGEYNFGINGLDNVGNLTSLNISTYDKSLEEGQTYQLIQDDIGNAWAGGYFDTDNSFGEFVTTNQENSGTLKINKFDFTNFIISGTFSFDLLDPYTGNIIQIREGRFDSHFSQ